MPTATKLKIPSRPAAKTVTAITVNLRNAPPDFIRDENSTRTTAADDDVSINNAELEVLKAKTGSKCRQGVKDTTVDGTAADERGTGVRGDKRDGNLKDDVEYNLETKCYGASGGFYEHGQSVQSENNNENIVGTEHLLKTTMDQDTEDCQSRNRKKRYSKRISALSAPKETNQQVDCSSKCGSVADSVSSKQNDSTEKPTTVATCNPAEKGRHVKDDYYEIECVLNVRFLRGKIHKCLVRWKGCTDDDDSWEPASGLCDTAFDQAKNWLSNQVEYKQILTQLLIGLIDTLKENDRDEIFLEEVTDDKVPGYSNVVKQPICLITIENRVRKSVYKTLDELKKDVNLMFNNCIKFTSYVEEATQQRGMFTEKYRDAYNQLDKHMNQSLELEESSKGPISKSISSTPRRARSIAQKTRLSKHSAANQKPQQLRNTNCRGMPKTTHIKSASNAVNSKGTSVLSQKAVSFTNCKDVSKAANRKRTSGSSAKKEKQHQCPQADSLSECRDVCQPPLKNQDLHSRNRDERYSKRISGSAVANSVSSKQNDNTEKPTTVATCNSTKKGCHVEDGYYEIDKILNVRFLGGKMKLCLVRWKGCTDDDDSWEPASDLTDTAFDLAKNWLSNQVEYKQILSQLLNGLVNALKENDREKIFLEEVVDKDVPGYSDVIKQPMCLFTIEDRVTKSHYTLLEEFEKDVNLMYANGIKFGYYRKEAQHQKELFRKEYRDAANQLGKRTDQLFGLEDRSANRCSPSITNRKRSELQSSLAKKRSKVGPRCREVEMLQCSSVPVTYSNQIGGNTISCIMTGELKNSLLSNYFPKSALLVIKCKRCDFGMIRKSFTNSQEEKFQLTACEVTEVKCKFNKQYGVDLLYVMTEKGGNPVINLQQELEKLCCFGKLGRQKVIARLKHLQSEVKGIVPISCTQIEKIKETGQEGCGFVPPNFFESFGDRCPYKNADAIQVRIIGANIGLIKGILLVKEGIDCIQIPDSMIKAPPSEVSNDNGAFLIFKTASAPSKDSALFERYLDPIENTTEGFITKSQRELSEMYQRALTGLGVSKQLCNDYVKQSRRVSGLKHWHLMGVADPTGKIPYGEVFIPGYSTSLTNSQERDLFGRCLAHGKIFISRSPCLEPTDAKILPVLQTKPKEMTDNDWRMLCGYKFGTIIFGLPKKKSDVPIPNVIADGDLDGDLYFVLWDEAILGAMLKPKNKLAKKAYCDLMNLQKPETNSTVDKSSNYDRPYRKNWLAEAQNDMIDAETQCQSKMLVGKLYCLCFEYSWRAKDPKKKDPKRENGRWDIYDEDAVAFAKAYKDAMDMQKHGGMIYLPRHLHEELPVGMRKFLSSKKGK